MGNFSVVSYEGSEITLSMAKWGAIRRFAFFFGKKFRLINRFSIALFLPMYEIAIYEGSPRVVFSKKPFIIFYYPDEGIARAKLKELAALVEEGGLLGDPLRAFLRNGEPRQQGHLLMQDS